MVQSDSPEIIELARQLTSGVKNEYEAVTVITNHVADAIKYTFNLPKYDALYTLKTQNPATVRTLPIFPLLCYAVWEFPPALLVA